MKNAFLLIVIVITSFTVALGQKTIATGQKSLPSGPVVEIKTDYGTMKVKLYDATPLHRDNFIKLTNEGFYDGLLFHRVIKEFMIQGGDPDSKNAPAGQALGSGGPGYTVPAEINNDIIHKKGALCAARTNNPEKASSGCQFYIVQGKVYTNEELDLFETRMGYKFTPQQRGIYTTIGGTPHLDRNYTVYGEVIEGLDVVDKIAAVETAKNLGDRPVKDVTMTIKVVK